MEPEAQTGAGGADGGTATAEAVSSQPNDQELLSTLEPGAAPPPDPNADLWEKVRGLDFTKAPQDVREKIEAPFLSLSSKKINEVEGLRQTFLQAIDKLAKGNNGEPQQPVVDQKAALLEEINNGNFNAVAGLVQQLVAEQVGPQMAELSRERSIKTAAEMMPELPKYEKQVADALQADPELLYLASVNNNRFTPKILAGLAWREDAIANRQELAKLKAEVDTRVKAGIEDYQRKLKGLPSSTSQAGKAPTAYPSGKPMSMEEIREQAWKDAGGA